MTTAEVRLWGRTIGSVALTQKSDSTGIGSPAFTSTGDETAAFQYDREFAQSGIQVSPIAMPLTTRTYRFPELPRQAFHGLPGLLADSLPDKFGNALIDAWLVSQGRKPGDFDAVERLCYSGSRGMGALEFVPAIGGRSQRSEALQVEELVKLASSVLSNRAGWSVDFAEPSRAKALLSILRVGTSAGGARAKAVIAWNPTTNDVRSGHVKAGDGYSYWLLKFDGVAANRDKELVDDPQGFGAIEYAYFLMARAAGITMSECRLLEEGGRRHFMTKRFDRTDAGGKLHMQTLGAIAHYDYNLPGGYSYEQTITIIRTLRIGPPAAEEQFRRMVFNVVARNQDDHVKNIAFLMDRAGEWTLSPAYDITYGYNPLGDWTSRHQMTINGKRDDFTIEDFRTCANIALMKQGRAETILAEVVKTVKRWPEFAASAVVSPEWTTEIAQTHRLSFPRR